MKRKGANLSELLQMISPRHRFFQVCMLTRSSPQIRVVKTKISSEPSHTIKCETVLVTRTLHLPLYRVYLYPLIYISYVHCGKRSHLKNIDSTVQQLRRRGQLSGQGSWVVRWCFMLMAHAHVPKILNHYPLPASNNGLKKHS